MITKDSHGVWLVAELPRPNSQLAPEPLQTGASVLAVYTCIHRLSMRALPLQIEDLLVIVGTDTMVARRLAFLWLIRDRACTSSADALW